MRLATQGAGSTGAFFWRFRMSILRRTPLVLALFLSGVAAHAADVTLDKRTLYRRLG